MSSLEQFSSFEVNKVYQTNPQVSFVALHGRFPFKWKSFNNIPFQSNKNSCAGLIKPLDLEWRCLPEWILSPASNKLACISHVAACDNTLVLAFEDGIRVFSADMEAIAAPAVVENDHDNILCNTSFVSLSNATEKSLKSLFSIEHSQKSKMGKVEMFNATENSNAAVAKKSHYSIEKASLGYKDFSLCIQSMMPKMRCVAVACGKQHVLGCTQLGNMFSFGENEYGQLGVGDNLPRITPTFVTSIYCATASESFYSKFHAVSVFAGYYSSFAFVLSMDQNKDHSFPSSSYIRLFGWGNNNEAQLGISSMPCGNASEDFVSTVHFQSKNHISGSSIVNLPRSPEKDTSTFEASNVNSSFKKFSTSVPIPTEILCPISSNGSWGTAWPLKNATNFLSIGFGHTAAVTQLGAVYVWGSNLHGQLGLGHTQSPIERPVPIGLFFGIPIKQVSCGVWHTLFLSEFGDVFSAGTLPYCSYPPPLSVFENNGMPFPNAFEKFKHEEAEMRKESTASSPVVIVQSSVLSMHGEEHFQNVLNQSKARSHSSSESIDNDKHPDELSESSLDNHQAADIPFHCCDDLCRVDGLPDNVSYISAGAYFSTAVGTDSQGTRRVVAWGIYRRHLPCPKTIYLADIPSWYCGHADSTVANKPLFRLTHSAFDFVPKKGNSNDLSTPFPVCTSELRLQCGRGYILLWEVVSNTS